MNDDSGKSPARLAAKRGAAFSLYTIPLWHLLGDGWFCTLLGRAALSPTACFVRRRGRASVKHGSGIRIACAASYNPQNPAFDFDCFAFMLGQAWAEKASKAAIQITPAEPFRGGIGVLLMRVAAIAREAVTP